MPVDHLGRRAHRQRRLRPPHRESANRLPQVAEVPDLPTAQVSRSLRLFGWPAHMRPLTSGSGPYTPALARRAAARRWAWWMRPLSPPGANARAAGGRSTAISAYARLLAITWSHRTHTALT